MKGWTDVKVSANHTNHVGKILWVPFYILSLLAIARISYFDNWRWSPSLVVFFGICAVYLFISLLLLRKAAETLRRDAITELKQHLVVCAGRKDYQWEIPAGLHRDGTKETVSGDYAKKLRMLIAEIETEKKGAFTPWFVAPSLTASLLPALIPWIEKLLAR